MSRTIFINKLDLKKQVVRNTCNNIAIYLKTQINLIKSIIFYFYWNNRTIVYKFV